MRTASYPGSIPKTVFYTVVLTLLMAVLAGGCASVQHDPRYNGASEQVAAPICTDICWVMSARNDNYFEARVYITGQKVATIPGMMGKVVKIPIRRSMLDGSGCMQIVVKLFPDTKTANSKACPVRGSQLELAVADSYGQRSLNLWLQDWRRR